jgi:hypothetical protein
MLHGVPVRFRPEVQSIESRINSGFFCFLSVMVEDTENAKGYTFEVKVWKRS